MSLQDFRKCDLLDVEDDRLSRFRTPFKSTRGGGKSGTARYARSDIQYAHYTARPHVPMRHGPPLTVPLERLIRTLRIMRVNSPPKYAAQYVAKIFSAKPERFADFTAQYEFNVLADRWEQETTILSSPKAKSFHPCYQEIIKMGKRAVPMILRRMADRGGHWFWALSELTGENPIPATAKGDIAAMREAWLKWGKAHGHI
jgi:hypothetical protein